MLDNNEGVVIDGQAVEVTEQKEEVSKHIQVTMDQINGYAAFQKEELAQTLALLHITNEQISQCSSAEEVEAVFDQVIVDLGDDAKDHVLRRMCRCITLIGLMSNTPIPSKFYLIDELVYKAVIELMHHQKAIQEEEAASEDPGREEAPAPATTH